MITKERLDELLAYDPETGLFTWKVRRKGRRVGTVAGNTNRAGYVVIVLDRIRYRAHRLAFLTMLGKLPPADTDHINGVRTDNRWANLRHATRSENNQNRALQSNNTSGVAGVSRDSRRNKWLARLKLYGKYVQLGSFDEFDAAVAARRAAEVKYFGKFSATASRVDGRSLAC